MNSTICVDAGFVLRLVIPATHSEQAERLWSSWLAGGTQIVAPALLPFDVGSSIRRQVQRGRVTEPLGAAAADAFLALAADILLVLPLALQPRAWELADRHHLLSLYDAYYVALVESLDCPLWCADDRLRRAMPDHAARIKSLRDR